ncbi:selenide, water dikinase SelD [Penaeicola halotolerans]|uniref:selenide, water dikinase SelD n=1 Tax=Penaeicola halotolerans TaxID=2793196 RepID=UPI001CF8ABD6|nr:selenide, water dikinase SelD [Penaeicola halotolerans]
MENEAIKLTQFSEGSGCGCKIAPAILEEILSGSQTWQRPDANLLVGNHQKDDAAVYQLSPDLAMINTVDFFTPIVDDPYDFGRIAAANALSDVYAMGGVPIFANAVLSWPVEKLAPALAAKVLEGAKSICQQAGVTIAGGHSIAAKDPIFGLSVCGTIHPQNIKSNSTAQEGDLIYLTKKIGIGVLATALKRGKINPEDYQEMVNTACQLNSIGQHLGQQDFVHAMTDVTGFGLLGHLIETCEGAGLSADLHFKDIPLIKGVQSYIDQFIFPDNTYRNWNAYSPKTSGVNGMELVHLCDPQTSGGLLVAIDPAQQAAFETLMQIEQSPAYLIGNYKAAGEKVVDVLIA